MANSEQHELSYPRPARGRITIALCATLSGSAFADGYGNTDGLFFWLIAFSVGFVMLLLLLKLVSRWIRIPSWLASVLTFACVAAYGFGVSDAPSWLVIAALCIIVVGALLKYARGSR